MTHRITMNHLDFVCDEINDLLGKPKNYWDSELKRAHVGNRHIESTPSGYALAITLNEGGGISNMFGSKTKRGLMEKLEAYLMGLRTMKKQSEKEV